MSASEEVFPSEDRISGKHIVDYKKNDIQKVFQQTKEKILKQNG